MHQVTQHQLARQLQSTDDFALRVLRNPMATVADLEGALKGIDLDGAERRVDELEQQRHRMLAEGASDADIDIVDRELTIENRRCLRLTAAAQQIPERISARRARDKAADVRVAKVAALRLEAFAALIEIDEILPRLAKLLDAVRLAEGEAVAASYDLQELGRHSIPGPLEVLARHVDRRLSDLPPILTWDIPARNRLLGAAADLTNKG